MAPVSSARLNAPTQQRPSRNPGSQIVGRTFFVDGVVGFIQVATKQSRDKEGPHMSATSHLNPIHPHASPSGLRLAASVAKLN